MIASRGYKRGARQKRRELFLPKEARLFENLRDRYIEQVRVSNFHSGEMLEQIWGNDWSSQF